MEWRDIASALESLPFEMIGKEVGQFKSYASALVYGPTWVSDNGDDWPARGKGSWTGEWRVAIASTYEGKGFWTIETDAPSDYEVHIQPVAWMPLPDPPADWVPDGFVKPKDGGTVG